MNIIDGWAWISLVGQRWPGKASTPAYNVPLPAGRYRVRLRNEAQGIDETINVEVKAGEEKKLFIERPRRAEGPVR